MSIILPGVQTIISAPRFSSAIWMKNEKKKELRRKKELQSTQDLVFVWTDQILFLGQRSAQR